MWHVKRQTVRAVLQSLLYLLRYPARHPPIITPLSIRADLITHTYMPGLQLRIAVIMLMHSIVVFAGQSATDEGYLTGIKFGDAASAAKGCRRIGAPTLKAPTPGFAAVHTKNEEHGTSPRGTANADGSRLEGELAKACMSLPAAISTARALREARRGWTRAQARRAA